MSSSITLRTRLTKLCAILAAGALIGACGGDQGAQTDTTTAAGGTPPAGTGTGTGTGASGGAMTEAQVTPQMVALGDSIFHGTAANGICYTCHGANAKGTELAPDLTDAQWLNGDGSLSFIHNTVQNGVPTPKQHSAPMPAFGQAFTPDQVNAVSAYVYSLTHPAAGGGGS